MAGLDPAIHVLATRKEDVDARHEAGHDDGKALERDPIRLNHCAFPTFWLRMIFSENRYPLFGIMR
jgi:hypothetical protein